MSKRQIERELEDRIILRAISIIETRLQVRGAQFERRSVKDFLRLQAHGLAHEVFAVMYLDAQNRLIAYEKLFRGTLTRTAVYPREIVKQVLAKNAASVILHHNHPSGCCTPSTSDSDLTGRIRMALETVDVRLIDHVITSDEGTFSMAEESM
jgi:DNA repair protein RadC